MFFLREHFESVVRDTQVATLGGQRSLVPGTLAYADTIHYLRILGETANIAAVITTPVLAQSAAPRLGVVTADDPRTAFYSLHEKLLSQYPKLERSRGVDCRIHPSAIIGGHVRIGDRVRIGPGVIIEDNTEISDDVLIEPGARIGVEGILYLKGPEGIRHVDHAGGVRIGAGATIHANAVVVRSVHDSVPTIVGPRSIVGIASCVGHEAEVGADCVISGNCVIARNTIIGDEAFIGTNAYVRENIRVGAAAKVMAGAIVVTNVPDRAAVSGNFATSHERRLKEFANAR